MVSFLFRILLVVLALWIVRRFLGTLLGEPRKPGRKQGTQSGSQESKMVRDPVCGMYMDPRLALRHDHKKGTFYFCSEECRRKYLA